MYPTSASNLISIVVILFLGGAAELNAQAENKNERGPMTAVGEWSKPVNGVCARLVVNYEEIESAKHPTYFHYRAVILEVKNVDGRDLTFGIEPMFKDVETRNAKGKVIPKSQYEGNHIAGITQWVAIPGNVYIGTQVDTPIPAKTGMYVATMTGEKHSLHATLVATFSRNGPKNQWVGEIVLPAVLLSPTK